MGSSEVPFLQDTFFPSVGKLSQYAVSVRMRHSIGTCWATLVINRPISHVDDVNDTPLDLVPFVYSTTYIPACSRPVGMTSIPFYRRGNRG